MELGAAILVSGSEWQGCWSLDPKIVYLNHGAFGATPRAVLELQQQLRDRLEAAPVRFIDREFEGYLDRSREQLAAFLGADASDLVFVQNATTGVNAVLRSLKFSPGDELLVTNHEYNACRNAVNFVASRTGAKVVVAKIPFPLDDLEQIVEAVLAAVTPRTKLALLDHVTSQTALVFPIQQLVRELKARGVETLVDGAHALGMVPLNLAAIGATYYAGNCHKWLCAPKGAGFLYVEKEKQAQIRPLTISHGANSTRTDKSRWQLEFDWTGTNDATAYFCVPEAIKFMGGLLPGGWDELMSRNRLLALRARKLLCEKLGITPPAPEKAIASMAVMPLPQETRDRSELILPLQQDLSEQFQIEVPVIPFPAFPQQVLRISVQIYNSFEQYQYLAEVLGKLLTLDQCR
ncbi:MAG: aminotransferase class V-fold PLP-dependent enzyme [Oscillatoria sp. PMC 1068.18]|nr:aminotransferase class V-fold PLP-dependent enzyme [Oscillatoria sp. PMC 1076.18]MEC4988767.1 aminotransferase class V-fold PLP-dependent enzyme [Oscillatoria sp. PMC 1068.18]